MDKKGSVSINVNDYDILVRKRGENTYAAYCPQLNLMLTGNEHEEVYGIMINKINEHIENLKKSN